MNTEKFWRIIDEANTKAGKGNQDEMLECTEALLSELPPSEIAEWFNIHHLYLDLADRKDLERAAAGCNIYLSDDSFLYFRGWLLSLGKDAFYNILNNPDTLSNYVKDPSDTRFESFVYAGHSVYAQKAWECDPEGMMWKENWLAENPDKGDYAFNWALGNKYSLWDASSQNPLSDEAKENIRRDLFSESDSRKITVAKMGGELKEVEKVLLDMLPTENKNYRRLSIGIYSGYGVNLLPAGLEAFHQEMKDLFSSAGWERHEPQFSNACPEYSKGKSRLYCHPTEISGPCEEDLIPEVCKLVSKATTCTITRAEDQGRVYDITQEQYNTALEKLRPKIEQDLLTEFSRPSRTSDSDRHEAVMLKYRVLTMAHHTDTLMSTHPYWKYTEDVLKDLIAQEKIVKRPEANSFTSWNYITAPEHQMDERPAFDSQVQSASARAAEAQPTTHEKTKEPELEK